MNYSEDRGQRTEAGFTLPAILGLSVLFLGLTTALIASVTSNYQATRQRTQSLSALEVAEAGINYYLWHLAHDPEDYCDGSPCQGQGPYGPYVHNYTDPGGNAVGTYSITIEPPNLGSTLVKVTSLGQVGSKQRQVEAQIGLPSFAQYAWVINNRVWFGSSATTYGPVHSNNGIRFDGHATRLVTSAQSTYDARCVGGVNGAPGVWSQNNQGIFDEGTQFPVPAVDFNAISADLQQIRTDAQANGLYLAASGSRGYYLHLTTTGIDVYRVTNENKYATSGGANNLTKTFLQTSAIPGNGLVFVEDYLWIDGQTDDRLTIAAARFPDIPGQRRDIYIVDNLRYTVEDGTVALGLVAQRDIRFAHYVPPAGLEVDAYLLSANGGVGYIFASSFLNRSTKAFFTLNGGIGSYLSTCDRAPERTGYGMVTSSSNDGFLVRNYYFDNHLTFNPPPQFPKTGAYAIISWQEVEVTP
jgi:type II secretory pathway pseudopilin PulG